LLSHQLEGWQRLWEIFSATPTYPHYDRDAQYHFSARQGCKKLAKNNNVGQQSIWGQDPVNQSNKLNNQFYKRQKTVKMTKRTTDIMVAVATAVWQDRQ
jgi:hypothetical protein